MILLDLGTIWALYVVALMVGVAETLYDTSAQSILPQVVNRERLSRANSRLYAVELTANQFIGPPLGGLLVGVGLVGGMVVEFRNAGIGCSHPGVENEKRRFMPRG